MPFWRPLVSDLAGILLFSSILTILDFLDHVLRENPSRNFLAIRRSFFDSNGANRDIGNGVLAFKGVYQAIRPALVSSFPIEICWKHCHNYV
jgi:hypothetical protein